MWLKVKASQVPFCMECQPMELWQKQSSKKFSVMMKLVSGHFIPVLLDIYFQEKLSCYIFSKLESKFILLKLLQRKEKQKLLLESSKLNLTQSSDPFLHTFIDFLTFINIDNKIIDTGCKIQPL